MREELERVRQLAAEGYRLKLDYSQQGKVAKQEKHVSMGVRASV